MALTPLFDRVMVEKVDWDPTEHVPGLVIATSPPDDIERGRVLAAGQFFLPQGGTSPLPVDVGDTVVFKKNAGVKLTSYKKSYIVVPARELIAVEKKETP